MFSKTVVTFAFLIAVALSCITYSSAGRSPVDPAFVKTFADGGHPPPPPPTPKLTAIGEPVYTADGGHPPPPTPKPTAVAESVHVADGGHPPPPPWS